MCFSSNSFSLFHLFLLLAPGHRGTLTLSFTLINPWRWKWESLPAGRGSACSDVFWVRLYRRTKKLTNWTVRCVGRLCCLFELFWHFPAITLRSSIRLSARNSFGQTCHMCAFCFGSFINEFPSSWTVPPEQWREEDSGFLLRPQNPQKNGLQAEIFWGCGWMGGGRSQHSFWVPESHQ